MLSWTSPAVPSLPTTEGDGVPLSLYDSSTRSVRPTAPGPTATLYVCGITPYDATHLGHAATYLTFDLVQRQWLDLGHRVQYVQNVTDVDDPLLERADRDGVAWQDLAQEQTELFRTDVAALRVLAPDHYVGAVEAMGEVAEAVERLLAAGTAYRLDDPEYPDVYFDITATGRFGYESGYDEATMLEFFAERGGDPDRAGKRQRLDPLLWRMARPGEPSWESGLGAGRAGWHIECAVIATSHLGPSIDVQGGGSDLIFPHHECSAAHAEALTGAPRFAQHYSHAGMIGLDGEKMSKSRGNLVLVSALREQGVDPMVIRLALLDGHYRADRAYSDDLLQRAQERIVLWRRAKGRTGDHQQMIVHAVRDALRDDLDTPTALAVLDRWAADDSLGGTDVAVAIDALLGVEL